MLKKDLESKLDIFLPCNFIIYSPKQMDEVPFVKVVEVEGNKFTVSIDLAGILDSEKEKEA